MNVETESMEFGAYQVFGTCAPNSHVSIGGRKNDHVSADLQHKKLDFRLRAIRPDGL